MKPKTFYSILCLMFLLGAVWNILCIAAILPLKLCYLSFAAIMLVSVVSAIMDFCKAKQDTQKKGRQNKKSPALSVSVFGRSVAHHICCLCFCSMTVASTLFLYFKTSGLQPLNAANHSFFAAASCLIVPE